MASAHFRWRPLGSVLLLVVGFGLGGAAGCDSCARSVARPDVVGGRGSGTDGAVGDTPGGDTSSVDTPSGDTPGGDTSSVDTPSGDTPGVDTSSVDTPSGDTPGVDTPSGDTPSGDTSTDTTPPPPTECTVVPGNTKTLLRGTVLTPGAAQERSALLVSAAGVIVCVGADCAGLAEAAGATELDCGDAVISPGLINAHDHITYTHNPPGNWGRERFDHRTEWRLGLNGHTDIPYDGGATVAQQQWGELRQVMAGTTAIAGAGGAAGFLRNLDVGRLQRDGIGDVRVDYDTFPLGSGAETYISCGTAGYSMPGNSTADCWLAHVAEGVNAVARNEFLALSGGTPGAVDRLGEDAAFIHGVGLTTPDIEAMALSGTALVWSPRTNISLYGETARVTVFHRLGALIALGTDWTPSGSVNMLRELACADELNRTYFDGFFSAHDLWLMATENGARALHVDPWIGALAAGRQADIAIYARHGESDPYRAVVTARIVDTLLVLRSGVPLYGQPEAVEALPGGESGCELLPGGVCGVPRMACVERETELTFASLRGAQDGAYGLFFCGVPDDEPTCAPFRPDEYGPGPATGDADGDGLSDAADNCPTVFNPVRPLDRGVQADGDGDGLGDVCDPCPLDPNVTECRDGDLADLDHDGVPKLLDLCPRDYDPEQADRDGDGLGDACDRCPDFADPDPCAACPATIYDLKRGLVPFGDGVTARGVVTGVAGYGFVMQVPDAEADPELGARYSGIFVYTSSDPPGGVRVARGDLVQVAGQLVDYYGERELSNVSAIVIEAHATPEPTPVAVQAAAVARGGVDAEAYEGSLVRLADLSVTALNASYREFQLDGRLWVNDFLFAGMPLPTVGQHYDLVQGVLHWTYGDSKLEPRDAFDLVVDATVAPPLVSFGSRFAPAYIEAEQADTVTSPPLVARLGRPAPSDLAVAFASDHRALGVGPTLTIPAGASEIEVPVTSYPVTSDTSVTVTATLGDVTLDAEVVVLPVGRGPRLAGLEPVDATLVVGRTLVMTVSLDIPACYGDVRVGLDVSDPSLLLVPPDVTVPYGQRGASFVVTALNGGDDRAVVTATLGADAYDASVYLVLTPPLGLVLSEVLYDADGSDGSLEWVELYNATASPIDLAGYSLGAGGADYTVTGVALAGTVPPGGCFVVGGPTSNAANYAPVFDLARDINPDLQNSGADADGVALFDVPEAQVTRTTVPIDAVIYGAANTSALLDETGAAGSPDAPDCPEGQTLERGPESTWHCQPRPTPNDCTALLAP